MQVGLKVWRFNSRTGERELQEYEIAAPEEATLLDCLDIVKDQHDGTLAYRKSCRMMICGSCGMRMDGAEIGRASCRERVGAAVGGVQEKGKTVKREMGEGRRVAG